MTNSGTNIGPASFPIAAPHRKVQRPSKEKAFIVSPFRLHFPFKPPDHSAALVDDEYRMPAGT